MIPAPLSKQPKGFWNISALTMAEYFSYYGMRSLLILFFTQYLLFSDQQSYILYGAYTSLVWVTPIIGGYLADRFLGYHYSVTLGVIMIFLGNVIIALSGSSDTLIYLAMATVICGYGFFKGNIYCLAGELYQKNDSRRDVGFSWLYVCGNIGALFAAALCGSVAYALKSWHAGFTLASIFLFFGVLFFLSGNKHFSSMPSKNIQFLNRRDFMLSNKYWGLMGLLLSILFFGFLLKCQLVGYFLLIAGFISLFFLGDVILKSTPHERKSIVLICLFMSFGMVFWVFDQQNGSSVTLFLQRNIDRHLFGFMIPSGSFQSVNAVSVIAGGFIVTWLWRTLKRANIHLPSLIKLSVGSLLLTLGFILITVSASQAHLSPTGQAHMGWIVMGMVLIGLAELFVDPVAISNITRLNPANSSGLLVGLYMLITGSFANYIAGKLASFTAIHHQGNHPGSSLVESAGVYSHVFKNISIVGVAITLLLVFLGFIIHRFLKVKEDYSG